MGKESVYVDLLHCGKDHTGGITGEFDGLVRKISGQCHDGKEGRRTAAWSCVFAIGHQLADGPFVQH